jgi:hypothetical protein
VHLPVHAAERTAGKCRMHCARLCQLCMSERCTFLCTQHSRRQARDGCIAPVVTRRCRCAASTCALSKHLTGAQQNLTNTSIMCSVHMCWCEALSNFQAPCVTELSLSPSN